MGRARLRKYIVTENVTATVPVSHDEVRIGREPITDGTPGRRWTARLFREEQHEVVLHAESSRSWPAQRARAASRRSRARRCRFAASDI